MFTNDSAAIAEAIRAGSIQQVQAEPRNQPSAARPATIGRGQRGIVRGTKAS